jgi:hypothetical protein
MALMTCWFYDGSSIDGHDVVAGQWGCKGCLHYKISTLGPHLQIVSFEIKGLGIGVEHIEIYKFMHNKLYINI